MPKSNTTDKTYILALPQGDITRQFDQLASRITANPVEPVQAAFLDNLTLRTRMKRLIADTCDKPSDVIDHIMMFGAASYLIGQVVLNDALVPRTSTDVEQPVEDFKAMLLAALRQRLEEGLTTTVKEKAKQELNPTSPLGYDLG